VGQAMVSAGTGGELSNSAGGRSVRFGRSELLPRLTASMARRRHARQQRDFLIVPTGLDRDTRLWQRVDVHPAAALQQSQAGRRNQVIRLYAPMRVRK
jgi:hypothetical protein